MPVATAQLRHERGFCTSGRTNPTLSARTIDMKSDNIVRSSCSRGSSTLCGSVRLLYLTTGLLARRGAFGVVAVDSAAEWGSRYDWSIIHVVLGMFVEDDFGSMRPSGVRAYQVRHLASP